MDENDGQMTGAGMNRRRVMSRAWRLAAGAGAAWLLPGRTSWAQARDMADTLKIGIVTDRSGENALLGAAEERGIRLAIDSANAAGGVLGRRIESLHFDTQTRPGYVERALPGFIQRQKPSVLIGGTSGGVAGAIAAAAQAAGVVYMDSNSHVSSASSSCHRTRFSWNPDNSRMAWATVLNVHRAFGSSWVLIVEETLWGRARAEVQRRLVEKAEGYVIGEIPVPSGGGNPAAVLEMVGAAGADAVFPAMDETTLERLAEVAHGTEPKAQPAWVVPAPDWPRLAGKRPRDLFGVFPVTWYWRLQRRGVPEFVKAYWRAFPDAEPRMPGSFVHNGYTSARALFNALSQAGSGNRDAVIRELEAMRFSAAQRLQHDEAWMDPATHSLQQPVYLASANPNPRHPEDLFQLLAWTGAGEIARGVGDDCLPEPLAVTPQSDV